VRWISKMQKTGWCNHVTGSPLRKQAEKGDNWFRKLPLRLLFVKFRLVWPESTCADVSALCVQCSNALTARTRTSWWLLQLDNQPGSCMAIYMGMYISRFTATMRAKLQAVVAVCRRSATPPSARTQDGWIARYCCPPRTRLAPRPTQTQTTSS
jgi:hypothetical protein